MYGIVLLVALSAADGSIGVGKKGYPRPTYHDPVYPGGYRTLDGGYQWPGYACWGGCGGYASPAYGVPMTPLVTPRPPLADPDDKTPKKDANGKATDGKGKKPADDDDDEKEMKKTPPKKKPADDDDDKTAAMTLYLPAGAKLAIDGKPVSARPVKTFVTPPLKPGCVYYYDLSIELTRDGKPAVETRRVKVTAGESVHADYRDLGDRVARK